jgi:hypothetical protein
VSTKRRRPARDACLRDAGPFKVTSLVNGNLTVESSYAGVRIAEGCTRDRDQQGCRACGAWHIYGVFGRMALASRVQDILNSYVACGTPVPVCSRPMR